MTFIFDRYEFDAEHHVAAFYYVFSDGRSFCERIAFHRGAEYNQQVLEQALWMAFLLIGTSYYKAFPTCDVEVRAGSIDDWQAKFLNVVYQEGLSQFAFENSLTRGDLAQFVATGEARGAMTYNGTGTLALQSGGKDSLLIAAQLRRLNKDFTPFYVSSGASHPAVLDELGQVVTARRYIDCDGLQYAAVDGGLNGHVPVTYIVQAIALVQAILLGKNTILVAIGHEGAEPHAWIDDLPVNHQWSKTWQAEQLFAEYVQRYVSPDLRIGSPLRQYSELKVTQLFAQYAWTQFGRKFSSCNEANYRQGTDNTTLSWCGECPKCANSYLLFAPFVDKRELDAIFNGKDLLRDLALVETFKGLLGIDGVMKPFECVGEIDELRRAYHDALSRGYGMLPFDVPESPFGVDYLFDAQGWATEVIQ